jgi:SPP1 family predicted phage head-tail adaptor
MSIGKLRHSITIEQGTRVSDGMGGASSTTWATFATSFAELFNAGSRERAFGNQRELNITHRIRMRYQAGITANMRVKFGTRVFQIHGTDNEEERNIWLNLLCEEGVQA